MALLSNIMRTQAVWGRTDTLDAWVMGRQGGRWAQQTVRAAMPTATRARARDPAATLRDLEELHRRGVVTDAEFEALRPHLPA
jgi:hypothetical protein